MRKFLFLLGMAVLLVGLHESGYCQSSEPAQPVKTGGLALIAKVVSYPAVHPLSTLYKSVGAVIVPVEAAVDVVHDGFVAADSATAVGSGKYFGPIHLFFHGGNIVSGYADQGVENAESFLGLPVD